MIIFFGSDSKYKALDYVDSKNIIVEISKMNWDQVQGQWKQVKGKVVEKWGKLTNDDLDVIDGNKEQLLGKIQERYGYGKEQAQKELDEFAADFDSARNRPQ